jgi:hypothetical protein
MLGSACTPNRRPFEFLQNHSLVTMDLHLTINNSQLRHTFADPGFEIGERKGERTFDFSFSR